MKLTTLRPLIIGIGVASSACGLSVLIFGTLPESGLVYEGSERYISGFIFLLMGLFLLVSGWMINRKEIIRTIIPSPTILLCPSCGVPYDESEIESKRCPNCSVALECIEGFYERHPEFSKDA